MGQHARAVGRIVRPLPRIALVALAVAIVAVLTIPTAAAGGLARPELAPATHTNPGTCPQNITLDEAAMHVPLHTPRVTLHAGDVLTSQFELKVNSTTLSPLDVRLNIPSYFANFPLANGTTLETYLPPRTMDLTNLSWSNPALASKAKTMTATTTFATTDAQMTSQLLSMMATAPYGTLSLAFRWHWSVTYASNGSTLTSSWTVPTAKGKATIFHPAPYVDLASTSNTTTAIGAAFTADVLGATSQTTFYSVLEYAATGNVIRNTPTSTPKGNATPDAIPVVILPYSGPMAPAALLDHLRNACGALLYSITVHAVYAAQANVTMTVSPSSCGPLTFNGTKYPSGSVAKLVPSPAYLAASVGTCAGHTFSGWRSASGVSVNASTSTSTTAVVSASGSLTATFH
jgi:hypothetical protein